MSFFSFKMVDGSGIRYVQTEICSDAHCIYKLSLKTSLISPCNLAFYELRLGYRRKAFWVAKQILQLGMGDAFDDWLIEKIQIQRRGSVVASGIRLLEQVYL